MKLPPIDPKIVAGDAEAQSFTLAPTTKVPNHPLLIAHCSLPYALPPHLQAMAESPLRYDLPHAALIESL